MNWIKRFGPLIVVALAVAAVIASGLADHLSLAELKERRDQLQGFVALHPALSFGLYILIYIGGWERPLHQAVRAWARR